MNLFANPRVCLWICRLVPLVTWGAWLFVLTTQVVFQSGGESDVLRTTLSQDYFEERFGSGLLDLFLVLAIGP